MNAFLYQHRCHAYFLGYCAWMDPKWNDDCSIVYYGCYPDDSDDSPALDCNFSVRIFF